MNVEKPDWLEQMEGILETLNEGVLIADDCQRILIVNECMERLMDPPRSSVLGKTPAAIYSGKDTNFSRCRSTSPGAGAITAMSFLFLARTERACP